jgi:hypothetical protein
VSERALNDLGNGAHDREMTLKARVAALRSATQTEAGLLAAYAGSGPRAMGITEAEADAHRNRVLVRAERLESWLLRPAGRTGAP